jgi:hypothetical protein
MDGLRIVFQNAVEAIFTQTAHLDRLAPINNRSGVVCASVEPAFIVRCSSGANFGGAFNDANGATHTLKLPRCFKPCYSSADDNVIEDLYLLTTVNCSSSAPVAQI